MKYALIIVLLAIGCHPKNESKTMCFRLSEGLAEKCGYDSLAIMIDEMPGHQDTLIIPYWPRKLDSVEPVSYLTDTDTGVRVVDSAGKIFISKSTK